MFKFEKKFFSKKSIQNLFFNKIFRNKEKVAAIKEIQARYQECVIAKG